ncbi:hypothetical protein BJ741DRAFT_608841 [Chytriomyces cf. hyalinus JEL632]|nr:hypothetical protein BJ741DRAFT_608841 [Chytriomyces cf. hyalinus JEL632]
MPPQSKEGPKGTNPDGPKRGHTRYTHRDKHRRKYPPRPVHEERWAGATVVLTPIVQSRDPHHRKQKPSILDRLGPRTTAETGQVSVSANPFLAFDPVSAAAVSSRIDSHPRKGRHHTNNRHPRRPNNHHKKSLTSPTSVSLPPASAKATHTTTPTSSAKKPMPEHVLRARNLNSLLAAKRRAAKAAAAAAAAAASNPADMSYTAPTDTPSNTTTDTSALIRDLTNGLDLGRDGLMRLMRENGYDGAGNRFRIVTREDLLYGTDELEQQDEFLGDGAHPFDDQEMEGCEEDVQSEVSYDGYDDKFGTFSDDDGQPDDEDDDMSVGEEYSGVAGGRSRDFSDSNHHSSKNAHLVRSSTNRSSDSGDLDVDMDSSEESFTGHSEQNEDEDHEFDFPDLDFEIEAALTSIGMGRTPIVNNGSQPAAEFAAAEKSAKSLENPPTQVMLQVLDSQGRLITTPIVVTSSESGYSYRNMVSQDGSKSANVTPRKNSSVPAPAPILPNADSLQAEPLHAEFKANTTPVPTIQY